MQIHSEQAAWKEGMREDVIILEQGPCGNTETLNYYGKGPGGRETRRSSNFAAAAPTELRSVEWALLQQSSRDRNIAAAIVCSRA